MIIRAACEAELTALGALCLRSKAHWGYDAVFLAACREELTPVPADLHTTRLGVGCVGERVVGVVQVGPLGREADLLLLFVDPPEMGQGYGAEFFTWAMVQARDMGARRLNIDADPGAVPFYRRMGAEDAGLVSSASIPGRILPRLSVAL